MSSNIVTKVIKTVAVYFVVGLQMFLASVSTEAILALIFAYIKIAIRRMVRNDVKIYH